MDRELIGTVLVALFLWWVTTTTPTNAERRAMRDTSKLSRDNADDEDDGALFHSGW